MSLPRGLVALTIPVTVGAALTSGTAIALADGNDSTYLAKLHRLGIVWQPGGDNDLVALGHAICVDRKTGATPDEIASDVHPELSSVGVSSADATGIVSAAESTYCP